MECLPSDNSSVLLLRDVVKEFWDDELEHLDIAVENGVQHAPAHALLSTIMQGSHWSLQEDTFYQASPFVIWIGPQFYSK